MNWAILQKCERNCIGFPGLPWQSTINRAVENDRHLFIFFTNLKARNLKWSCWQGCFFLEGSEGGSAPCLSPRPWGLLATLGLPCLAAVSRSLCFLGVCAPMPKFPSSYMDIGHIGFSKTLTQCDLVFNLIASAKTLFLNKSHSQDLGLKLEHNLFGHTTQSTPEAVGNLTLSEVAITSWCTQHNTSTG